MCLFFRSATLLVLLALGAHAAPVAVTVDSEMTDEGRKVPVPNKVAPAYYHPVVLGFSPRGEPLAGETAPSPNAVIEPVARALADQGYLVTGPNKPAPTILLELSWGYLNFSQMLGDPRYNGDRSAILNRAGSTPATSENGGEYRTPGVVPEEANYYLLLSAYAWAPYSAERKKVLLWRTRITTPMPGAKMPEVIYPMVAGAARFFGRGDKERRHLSVEPAKTATARTRAGSSRGPGERASEANLVVRVMARQSAAALARPAPTPAAPVYYVAYDGGFFEEGDLAAGDKRPSAAVVGGLLRDALAGQGFKPASPGMKPSLVVTYHWGYIRREIGVNQSATGMAYRRDFLVITAYDAASFAPLANARIPLWRVELGATPSEAVAQTLPLLAAASASFLGKDLEEPQTVHVPLLTENMSTALAAGASSPAPTEAEMGIDATLVRDVLAKEKALFVGPAAVGSYTDEGAYRGLMLWQKLVSNLLFDFAAKNPARATRRGASGLELDPSEGSARAAGVDSRGGRERDGTARLRITVIAKRSDIARRQPSPSPAAPITYAAFAGGYFEEGQVAAGENAPSTEAMARLLHDGLASQGYKPAPPGTAPALVVTYHWGYMRRDGDEGRLPARRDILVVTAYDAASFAQPAAAKIPLWRVEMGAYPLESPAQTFPLLAAASATYLGRDFVEMKELTLPLSALVPSAAPLGPTSPAGVLGINKAAVHELIAKEKVFFTENNLVGGQGLWQEKLSAELFDFAAKSSVSKTSIGPARGSLETGNSGIAEGTAGLPEALAARVAAYQTEKTALRNALAARLGNRAAGLAAPDVVKTFDAENARRIAALERTREEIRADLARLASTGSGSASKGDKSLDDLIREFADAQQLSAFAVTERD